VVPLSDRSGMLRWIDGITAIYDIVKQAEARSKEQEERTRALKLQTTAGHAEAVKKSKALDFFAHKLAQHCAAAGLPKHVSRRDVPLPLLLQVFAEKERESGSHSALLLARELWLSSVSAGEVYLKQQSLTRSLSTMSMLGYVLGLGDRHLGNMLVSLSRGDVLHIDWHVSLERGRKLPIPEVVPFRLTRILQEAGGYILAHPQAERGLFHATATQVLQSVRAEHHVLTQLLTHTLVYHPLAEWQPLSAKPLLLLRKNADTRARTLTRAATDSSSAEESLTNSDARSMHAHTAAAIREETNRCATLTQT